MPQEGFVAGCGQSQGLVAARRLAGRVRVAFAPEDVHGQPPQDGQVLRGVARAGARTVFVHHDVQHPVQGLDAPVRPHGLQRFRRRKVPRTQVVALLGGGHALDGAAAFDHHDAGQAGPLPAVREPVDLRGDPAGALLEASVFLVDGVRPCEVVFAAGDGVEHERAHLSEGRRLVGLEGEQVVAALAVDLRGDLGLAADGVDRHQSPLHVQQIQQAGDGDDFVFLVEDLELAEDEMGLGAEGVDDVRDAAVGTQGAAKRLAVDGNLAAAAVGPGQLRPEDEDVAEMQRRDEAQDPAEGVVAGHAAREGAVAAQPVEMGAAEIFHVVEGGVAAEAGAEGGHQQVGEGVLLRAVHARVGHETEEGHKPVRLGDPSGGVGGNNACVHIYNRIYVPA